MMHRDARSLDHEVLEEMRRLAVKAYLDGEPIHSIAHRLEVHYQTVWKWKDQYERGGEEALASRKASGRPCTLAERQVRQLRKIIVGKNPQQLNFGPALWTLRLVGQLIEARYGVVLHIATIGRLLHRIGVTPPRPVRRAFQRDEAECVRWMTESFPEIVAEALRKQAVILFVDETGVHEDHPVGSTWAERGKTPVIRTTGQRRRVNVISALSPRGRFWFRCFQGTLTAPRYVAFLTALLHDIRKHVIVIHDRHPAHVAAATRRFVAQKKSRLRVYELPCYAPDLNPDEHVWSYVKGAFRRDPLHGDEKIDEAVERVMKQVKADRQLVRSFFGHPAVQYVRQALHWD